MKSTFLVYLFLYLHCTNKFIYVFFNNFIMLQSTMYKSHFSITENDLSNIQLLAEKMLPELPNLLDKFYEWMQQLPEYRSFFRTEEHVKHVKQMQVKHWQFFFRGQIDEEYIAFRKKVGEAHARIGLSLDIYCRSAVIFNDLFIDLFEKHNFTDFRLLHSFQKLVGMDSAIVVETYSSITSEALRTQSQILMQLSTPVTQLWEGILLLPLVGIVDSKRAQDIMSATLQKIASSQTKIFILDIAGVAVVDTAVANHFIKMTKATKLMGCRTIISGISPAIAQTIVELGIQIDEIMTTNSMQDALRDAFRLTNVSNIN